MLDSNDMPDLAKCGFGILHPLQNVNGYGKSKAGRLQVIHSFPSLFQQANLNNNSNEE